MFVMMKDINFKYNNSDSQLLNGFSLNIPEDKITCILGASGSGKSTILRLISGLEKPKKGFIKYKGQVIVGQNTFIPPEKRGVGMVFQDYALFPHMNLAENILFGVKETGRKKKKKLNQLLELIDLKDLKERYPHQISGGQQQRVALARALAIDPALILLDEPFSNLDANLKSTIRNDLKKILKKAGVTTVFVSHDKDDALDLADNLVVLKDGKIVTQGPAETVKSDNSKYVKGLFS